MRAEAQKGGFTWTERDDSILPRFQAMGDPFDRQGDPEPIRSLPQPPLGRRHRFRLGPPRADNVMIGSWRGHPAVAFEYRYSVRAGHGDRERVEHRSIGVACLSSGLQMPSLSVRPEQFLGRAVGKLLGNDIELESEQFNRAFTVNSEDRRFATDFLHPRKMELMLTKPKAGVLIRGEDLVRLTNGQMRPAQLRSAFSYLEEILAGLPEHVRRELPATTEDRV